MDLEVAGTGHFFFVKKLIVLGSGNVCDMNIFGGSYQNKHLKFSQ